MLDPNIKEIITTTATILGSIGILAAGTGYTISLFRKGGREENKEVTTSANQLTDFWRDQVEGFKAMVAAQDIKIQALTDELNKMKGIIESKDKQIDSLQATLSLRNPEMTKFMEFMIQSVKNQSESHGKIVELLTGLLETSASNHDMLQKDQDKELKIESIVTKK